MLGRTEDCGSRTSLDDLPGIHHGDVVAELGRQREVVGHEEYGEVLGLAQLTQEIDDLRLDRHVKRRRRFVGDEQTRVTRQCHGDHDPLTHST